MKDIIVEDIHKSFLLAKPNKENSSFLRRAYHYLVPEYEKINSLNGINFNVERGERVALIGPNGAGKSTTIKILTGIMCPSTGTVKVMDKVPFKERQSLARDIGVVFGHCSQLWTHLPVRQSYEILSAIYGLDKSVFKSKLAELVTKFDITHLLKKPVNKLSLGERMRCEIVAGLLHSPKVLLFDEPTIGLDIIAKANLRDIILNLVEENNNTLLLTSHDTSDIERICERVIIVDRGEIVLDSTINDMKNNYTKRIVISIISDDEITDWTYNGTQVVKHEKHNLKVSVDLAVISKEKIAHELLQKYTVKDISFESPSLETIIRNFYESNAA